MSLSTMVPQYYWCTEPFSTNVLISRKYVHAVFTFLFYFILRQDTIYYQYIDAIILVIPAVHVILVVLTF